MKPEWEVRIDALSPRLVSLVAFLRAGGYRFVNPDGVLPGPDLRVESHLQRLEMLVGAVPAALAYFYRTVGSIDLRGGHPAWTGCDLSDPLVVDPIGAAVEEAEEYSMLENPAEEYWACESGVFRIPIAADANHKGGSSGGMWLGVQVPNANADPIVLEEAHVLPFTRYLELVLAWGGFLGLESSVKHTWPLEELRGAAARGMG